MTAKRYVAILETASYKDTATGEVLCPKHEKDYYTVLDRLNRYDEDCKMYRNDALKAEKDKEDLLEENEQLKSDKEHLMGCLIRFFGYDDEDIDYNLNRESNREYGEQYYSMKEETKKELEE